MSHTSLETSYEVVFQNHTALAQIQSPENLASLCVSHALTDLVVLVLEHVLGSQVKSSTLEHILLQFHSSRAFHFRVTLGKKVLKFLRTDGTVTVHIDLLKEIRQNTFLLGEKKCLDELLTRDEFV